MQRILKNNSLYVSNSNLTGRPIFYLATLHLPQPRFKIAKCLPVFSNLDFSVKNTKKGVTLRQSFLRVENSQYKVHKIKFHFLKVMLHVGRAA